MRSHPVQQQRITCLNDLVPRAGKYVLYWMQRVLPAGVYESF